MIQKNDPSPAFHKNHSSMTMFIIVFMTPRKTYLYSIDTLACSKAEI